MNHTTYHLTAYLVDYNLYCGEIIQGQHLAEALLWFEKDNQIELTSQQIHKSIWDAGESFVDSMQANACDTPEWQGDELDQMLEHYESMRPSKKRLAALVAIVC